MKTLDKICNWIDKVLSVITVVAMVFLTVLIGVNVVARFIFNSPIAWQYEATLVSMPWVIFLGMSMAFKNDEHMRLTFVANAMPEKTRNIFIVILDMIVVAFLLYGGYISISVVQNAIPTLYQTIPVSRAFFYLPFPIGCLCSVLMIITNSYKRIKGIPFDQPIE